MASIQGKATIFGTAGRDVTSATPIAFTLYPPTAGATPISGYIMPIVSGFPINHQSQNDRVIDEEGEVASTIGFGEALEATFDLVPVGATLAEARTSAQLPPIMSTVSITGADVVAVGIFTDAVNVTTGSPGGNRWIYEGGGTVNWRSDGHATLSLPLRRYPKIVGGTAILS